MSTATTTVLTTPQVAERLNIHEHTLRHWLSIGAVEADYRTDHGQVLWLTETVDRLLDEASHGDHGPECPLLHRVGASKGRHECGCVACHCGPRFQPGGFMGSCSRCHRPRVINGKVVR